MRIIIHIFIAAFAAGCFPKNHHFNPFDDEFRFHGSMRPAEYDTLRGECGYWHLRKEEDGLEVFYQFFLGEKQILAKGFKLTIDKPFLHHRDSLNNLDYLEKLYYDQPIDHEYIKKKLAAFGVKQVNIMLTTERDVLMEVELVDMKGFVHQAYIETSIVNDKFARYICFYHPRGHPEPDEPFLTSVKRMFGL